MNQENARKQPLIRYVNRQPMSWRAVDVERLVGDDHLARVAPNCPTPLLPGCQPMPEPDLDTMAKDFICGSSPGRNIVNYVAEGASKGAFVGLIEGGPAGAAAGGATGALGGLGLAIPANLSCIYTGQYGN